MTAHRSNGLRRTSRWCPGPLVQTAPWADARSEAVDELCLEFRVPVHRPDESLGPGHTGEVGVHVCGDEPSVVPRPQQVWCWKFAVFGRTGGELPGAPVADLVEGTAKQQVLPGGDRKAPGNAELRAVEDTRWEPWRRAPQRVAVHAADGSVPERVKTVLTRLRLVSQIHPQTAVKNSLRNAILVQVMDPGVGFESGRPHGHQLLPGLVALREPVRGRGVR